ncbi:MAG: phosphoribosylglycinamide formyltransferase [Lachnospiraceae bacterium]|nr:phosphoribosylglycinamide formyltransferase [Lachnospiraceae bacterium]
MKTKERICVLTYQTVHRKTMDTLFRLKINGYENVCVYAKPFHYIKKYTPLIVHRPVVEEFDCFNSPAYSEIIYNLGYEVRNIDSYEEIDEVPATVFLVCGAGLIPAEVLHKYCIINAHPGYIPVVRGLDALKWAIVEGNPIGVTTHVLGDYVDAGDVIERRKVPIYNNDTFHTVAYRQYEMEIQMLVRAIEQVGNISFFSDGEDYPVHRRMPNEIEKGLYHEFENYKNRIC